MWYCNCYVKSSIIKGETDMGDIAYQNKDIASKLTGEALGRPGQTG